MSQLPKCWIPCPPVSPSCASVLRNDTMAPDSWFVSGALRPPVGEPGKHKKRCRSSHAGRQRVGTARRQRWRQRQRLILSAMHTLSEGMAMDMRKRQDGTRANRLAVTILKEKRQQEAYAISLCLSHGQSLGAAISECQRNWGICVGAIPQTLPGQRSLRGGCTRQARRTLRGLNSIRLAPVGHQLNLETIHHSRLLHRWSRRCAAGLKVLGTLCTTHTRTQRGAAASRGAGHSAALRCAPWGRDRTAHRHWQCRLFVGTRTF